ncbi:extracellular solute-binding protein [Cohnella silvisoli]|uniref:Extracellular solute-binding protein n=1 Tax=Cohnella silvisoli TaxID=2873699 RepID=A0ABV1KSP6_9BACL|nr:extracellular solute-binding protein [Cohnella silvisoli]MCD9021365.1 extracellular solute-binding protein [Cohnella silvisoli]
MKRKVATMLLTVTMLAGLLLSACSKNEDPSPAASSSSSAPSSAASSESASPSADPNAQKVSIELMENGWANIPLSGDDPFKKWIDETFNVDFKLTSVPDADLESKLLVEFASGDGPDIIFAYNKNVIKKLNEQGMLLEDLTPYLDKVPTLAKSYSDQAKAFASSDGKMIGLPTLPDPGTQTWMIRKDWLDALSLQMPTNDQELLDVLRKFTNGDPDKNGKKDTYGISSAGGGGGLGEILFLESMYGQVGFHVENGKVVHSITNGTHKKFLDFLRTAQKEKLIDPDWLTQGWEQRKAQLFAGKIGSVYYPGVIVQESEGATGATGATVGWWDVMGVPKGSPEGGKDIPSQIARGMIAISKKAAEDPVKLDRIFQIIENSTFPNDGYWKMRWGKDVLPNRELKDVEGGAKYVNQTKEGVRLDNPGVDDYGTWIGTRSDMVLEGNNPDPGKTELKQQELDSKASKVERYPVYEGLINFDPQAAADTWKLQVEFDTKYVLGKTDDYDAFAKNWLNGGGQVLLDNATEQLSAMGLLK